MSNFDTRCNCRVISNNKSTLLYVAYWRLYVLHHPVLRNISMMMSMVNFVGSTTYAQLVLFSERQLHATDSQYSLMNAAGSAGVVVLSLLAGQFRKRWSFSRVALTALATEGLLTIALAFPPRFWLAVPLW